MDKVEKKGKGKGKEGEQEIEIHGKLYSVLLRKKKKLRMETNP
jgi:hypothetical protein